MLGLFVIIFSLAILALTMTQSIVLTGYIILPAVVCCIIFGFLRERIFSYIVTSVFGCMLAFISVSVFIRRYNHAVLPVSQSLIHSNSAGYTILIATGTIQEKQTHNRYLRQADNGALFFLYSNTHYKPGDYIWLTANAQPSSREFLSLFTDHYNKRHRLFDHWKRYRFDFQTRQIMKGVSGSLREKNSISLGTKKLKIIPYIKSVIQQRIDATFTTDRQRGIIAGMLLGDRSLLPQHDYQLFIDSGIVHIIAVSGTHMVTLVLFLQLLLFFLPFYVRIAIIIACIIAYGALCGLDGSVLRAVIMGALSLLALFRGKQTVVWRSLLVAYIIMLLINPFFLVYDIGFIFSFAAVIGIVYMGSRKKKLRLPQTKATRPINYILQSYVYPSLGASMMIAPFLLFFTGKFNLIAIIANILIFPLIPIVMIGGLVTTILADTWASPIFSSVVVYAIQYLYWVAQRGQKYAIYIVSQGQWFMYLLIISIVVLVSVDRLLSRKS